MKQKTIQFLLLNEAVERKCCLKMSDFLVACYHEDKLMMTMMMMMSMITLMIAAA